MGVVSEVSRPGHEPAPPAILRLTSIEWPTFRSTISSATSSRTQSRHNVPLDSVSGFLSAENAVAMLTPRGALCLL
jgi:hypothetical protein